LLEDAFAQRRIGGGVVGEPERGGDVDRREALRAHDGGEAGKRDGAGADQHPPPGKGEGRSGYLHWSVPNWFRMALCAPVARAETFDRTAPPSSVPDAPATCRLH